jgi:hypothetical protein
MFIYLKSNEGTFMQFEKLITKLSKTLFGTFLLTSTFCVAEDEAQPDHVPVGNRTFSHVEWMKAQENRYKLIQKIENGEELTDEEINNLPKEGQSKEESQADKQNQELVAKSWKSSSQYYTTHEGAFHHPSFVSLLGENVELEDGSIWTVSSGDRYKTLDWMTGDVIIILPNNSFFSSFHYCLVNLNTGVSVKSNLTLGPIYNGVFTHWIVAINYAYREICLEDGTVWKISSLDDSILFKWLPNDTVIIGINSGWLSGMNPNMLINVNTNNYVVGGCVN